jgi:hypothetical protein
MILTDMLLAGQISEKLSKTVLKQTLASMEAGVEPTRMCSRRVCVPLACLASVSPDTA